MADKPKPPATDPWAPPAGPLTQPGRRELPGQSAQRLTITGVEIPFWTLVRLLLKLSLAAIPALLVLILVLVALASIAGALLGTAILAALGNLLEQIAQSVSWPW